MNVLTINDRVGSVSRFPGVRAFIGCDDLAELAALRLKTLGFSCEITQVPLNQLPHRSPAELDTIQAVMALLDL